jgi:hypothetical protein
VERIAFCSRMIILLSSPFSCSPKPHLSWQWTSFFVNPIVSPPHIPRIYINPLARQSSAQTQHDLPRPATMILFFTPTHATVFGITHV